MPLDRLPVLEEALRDAVRRVHDLTPGTGRPVREVAPGKRAGRKTSTALRADFTTGTRLANSW